MSGPTGSPTVTLEVVARARPYLRSHLQSLLTKGSLRRASLRGRFLVVHARDKKAVPNPYPIETPMGVVTLPTYCATKRGEYDLALLCFPKGRAKRTRLHRQFPSLKQAKLPSDPRELDRLVRTVLPRRAPVSSTEKAEEKDQWRQAQ